MTHRTLALSPLLFVACTAIVAALVPAGARDAVVQGEVDLSKVLACAGMAAAALAFDRGDYLRRGWGVWAACYACLLGRDAMLLAGGHVSPAVYDWTRGLLVTAGNLFVVVGAWTLARAWTVAGLEHPGSRSARRAVVAAAVVVAVVFAGPTLYVDVRDIVFGPRADFDSIASDLGDILSLPLVAPVALTALAVREGTLRWTWMLLTSSLVAWLLYDAIYTLPDYLSVAPHGFRLVSEQLHLLAAAFAGAAGLAQRLAVTDADDDGP
ncbi:MAG TPA: hypothetical protein VHS09_12690, partial [Polyangiaceae bacterium]|jgi:hypothetical protein|nr:hypothetical protein [Polyangiaceae bacterium]